MIIDKEIISKTYSDYLFISGIIDINAKYFKKRIDEGVHNSDLNYQTNVLGKQTHWKFFNSDKTFLASLLQLIDYVEELDLKLEKFYLADSWGLIEEFGNYTRKHIHGPSYLSGILYLNDHYQKLYFPEIKQEIVPQEGRFVLFSSFLTHYTKRNLKNLKKYAISFNFFREKDDK
jgi:hypothetical protein